MLEILLVFFVGQRVVKLATEKGLPKTWALLVVLIPVMGFVAMFVAVIVITLSRLVPQDFTTLAALPFYLGAEGLTALLILNFMKKRPAGVLPTMVGTPGMMSVPPVPPMPVAETGESLAGYCSECEANKWLAADGSCPEGHPASSVSNVYSAPRTVA
jgi:hypothetical protein